jgi:putative peptidoglycan lipid II flippase
MMGGVIWYGMGSEQSWFAIPTATRALKLAAIILGAMAAYFATLRALGFRLSQFSRKE